MVARTAFALVLVASCFAGHSTAASKMHSWVHVFGFALVISVGTGIIITRSASDPPL